MSNLAERKKQQIQKKSQRIDKALHRYLPEELWIIFDLICYSARRTHVAILSGIGSGKSLFLAMLAALDLLLGYPIILLDPMEGTIEYLLMFLLFLPRWLQERIWKRIRLFDLSSNSTHVGSMSVFERIADEGIDEIGGRLGEFIYKLHPELDSAPIHGAASLLPISNYLGIVAYALGLQLYQIRHLLDRPNDWVPDLNRLQSHSDHAVREAASFFIDIYIGKWKDYAQDQRTISLKNHIYKLCLTAADSAFFSAPTSSIDFQEAVDKKLCLLFTFRNEQSETSRRFKTAWVLERLLQFARSRGRAGQRQPISVIIDEIAEVFSTDSQGKTLHDLLNIYARNWGLTLVLSTQDLFALPPAVSRALLYSPTSLIAGSVNDREASLKVAEVFTLYEMYKVKDETNVWVVSGSESFGETQGTSSRETSGTSRTHTKGIVSGYSSGGSSGMDFGVFDSSSNFSSSYTDNESISYGTNESTSTGANHSTTYTRTVNQHKVIDKRRTYQSIEEQFEIMANKFRVLPPLHFYCKVAQREGDRIGKQQEISLKGHTDKMRVDYKVIDRIKRILVEASGKSVKDILAEIEAHPGIGPTSFGTIKDGPPKDKNDISLPDPTDRPDHTSLGASDDEDF